MRRTIGVIVAVLGVLCLAGAAILYWVVVPDRAQVPSDLVANRQYAGTAKIALNPAAMAAGNLQQALIINQPANVDRTVKVIATSDGKAQVQEKFTATSGSASIGATNYTYALDRKSLAAVSSYPSGWSNVVPAQGLTVSFPIPSKKQNYTGWVNDAQTTTQLKYVKEESHAGIDTYVYESDTSAKPIKDPQILAVLPKAIPAGTLAQLAGSLPLPPDIASSLQALQGLPASVGPLPLSYTYEEHSTYWVQPTTGSVIDVQREEIRKAGLQLPTGATIAPVLPIYDVTTKGTTGSVASAADDAKSKADQLNLISVTLPLVLLIVGIVLLVVGLLMVLLRTRPAAHRPTAPPPATATPSGPAP